jgi:cytochrome c peroxidase
MGGTDNIPTSIGHKWQQGPINAPTVLNASMNLAQFWDGRAKDLKEQAGGPIANPGEMASTHKVAVEVLQSIPQYRAHFAKAFGSDQVDIDRVTTAIAAFEETLVTPGSRFDKWLEGDKKALNAQEVEGYELFKSSGCAGCHNGPAVGGALYQKFGVHHPYKTASKAEGRKAVTGKDTDLNVFKVPTLRNIELTYPYFHDGAAATLEDAVKTMGKIQLDRDFNKKEIDSIVAFLKTLTGDQPDIKVPVLPPSNNNTPRPVPF